MSEFGPDHYPIYNSNNMVSQDVKIQSEWVGRVVRKGETTITVINYSSLVIFIYVNNSQ